MIDGLKLKITNSELVKHCNDRAVYHRGRADEKEGELSKLRDVLERLQKGHDPEAVAFMNKGGYNNSSPVDSLANEIREHRNKGLVFEWISGHHLFPEDYNLDEDDLIKLEIVKRHW